MTLPPLRVPPTTVERCGAGNRITAIVDGQPVWFESTDRPLSAVGEVMGSSLYVPGLLQDRQLVMADQVSPLWLQNVPKIAARMAQWWQNPQYPPLATARTGDLQPRAQGSLLCFSGGVDAFHSLLCNERKPRHLVTAYGYDIKLAEESRWRPLEDTVRRVSAEAGIPCTIIRTNVRDHPLLKGIWMKANGGGLASLGHLMRDHGDGILVSASTVTEFDYPIGTHWDLDPWWSSEAMTIHHVGERISRWDKVQAIANEPLVQRNLRVCTHQRRREKISNCSHCEKCVRTMVALDQCGALSRFTVFKPVKSFIPLVDEIACADDFARGMWKHIVAKGLPADLTAAVERMLLREPVPRRHGWWGRMTKRARTLLRGR